MWKHRSPADTVPSLRSLMIWVVVSLRISVSASMAYWTSTEGKSLHCRQVINTNRHASLSLSNCVSLSWIFQPQTSCPQSKMAPISSHKEPSAIAWGLQSLVIMWFPYRIEQPPGPSPPPSHQAPTPRRRTQARLPQENNSAEMTTFPICSLICFL